MCVGTIIVPSSLLINQEFTNCALNIRENIELQNHKVKEVTTYTRPPRGRRQFPLRIAKITFIGRVLPDTLVIGGQRLQIREYIPSPRQCSKCWKYGHLVKFCTSVEHICPLCSERGHQKSDCRKEEKLCINCKCEHPAYSKSCSSILKG